MSIIAGSYERFIWGFKLKPTKHDADNQTLTLSPLFSYPSHLSSITTVALFFAASSAVNHIRLVMTKNWNTRGGNMLVNWPVKFFEDFYEYQANNRTGEQRNSISAIYPKAVSALPEDHPQLHISYKRTTVANKKTKETT
ncbi:hypothetical protein Bca52824_052312 [Brassica carinata]|uniref:Uncharacterized protein n=1 Tax=Brassica carinata TaxID=52824 RepID=A0A8X7R3R4_BRACI|nr:hypothetical protein Bca52824_052312 [Brassica carinata]